MYREDEQAIDSNDIKEILHHCNNRRLKAYLLVLASGGMRAIEALAIRECDIDFSGINFSDPNDRSNPAGIRIRKDTQKLEQRGIFTYQMKLLDTCMIGLNGNIETDMQKTDF